ncbi:MAG: hypothetical protein U0797_29055 [Gemmataceae bacterium]
MDDDHPGTDRLRLVRIRRRAGRAAERRGRGRPRPLFGDKLPGGRRPASSRARRGGSRPLELTPWRAAFRLDKMTLAALETTLRLYLNEDRAKKEVLVLRLLTRPAEELRRRAEAIAGCIAGLPGISSARAAEDVSMVGGGSLPEQPVRTWVVEVGADEFSEDQLTQRLRTGAQPVLARVREGLLVLDVRTVFEDQEEALVGAVSDALRRGSLT